MKRRFFAKAVMPVVFLLILPAGCGQSKLSRESALVLLRERGQPLLGSSTFTMHTDVSVPDSDSSWRKRSDSLLAIMFLDKLVEQGVLRRGQVRRSSLDRVVRHYYYSLPNPNVKENIFVKIDQKVTYLRGHFIEVTGISQEGNAAEVEVLTGEELTPIFKTIVATLDSLKEEGRDLRGNERVMRLLFDPHWVIDNPSSGAASRMEVRFKRYDDGWRIER